MTISGFIGHEVLWWDDGTQSDAYIGDSSNLTSRFRFRGEAKINPLVTAGFTYEWAAVTNSTGGGNQLNGGDDLGASGFAANAGACGTVGIGSSTVGCATTRDATVYMRHAQLGLVKIGQGSTANDNLVLIDLGGMGVAGSPDIANHAGGYILRSNNGTFANAAGINWTGAIRGHESWDNNRRNHVMYETPTLQGFTVQAAVAEDNYWDIALRYAGEFNGVRIAFGIGYQEDSEFNAGPQIGTSTAGVLCATNCNVTTSDLKGSGSILHVPTGLFVTFAAGKRELEGSTAGTAATAYTGPDLKYWYVAGGLSRNFFGIGNTVLFAEASNSQGGLEQSMFLGTTAGYTMNVGGVRTTSEVDHWGLGITQYVDAAAMEVFAAYKNYSLDANGFGQANLTLNNGSVVGGLGVHDISVFLVGTRINF